MADMFPWLTDLGKKRMSVGSTSTKPSSSTSSSSTSSSSDALLAQQQMQAQMQAQMKKQREAIEAERKRREAEEAERIRQQNIQTENQKAADFRRQSENKIQSNFNSAAQNQQRLDQQSAQNYSTAVGGSGYNIGSAQQQKIAAAGGVAGPASTNTPSPMQMGLPIVLASNTGVGGTQQNTNFTLPSAQGLQFGGM
jgi:hypothetical protein